MLLRNANGIIRNHLVKTRSNGIESSVPVIPEFRTNLNPGGEKVVHPYGMADISGFETCLLPLHITEQVIAQGDEGFGGQEHLEVVDKTDRHILAFWYYGNFALTGNTPYLLLPALGYDQRRRSGRGYTFGRFRGEDLMYGETEYRFPISMNTGLLGGLLFANCTTTSDKAEHIYLFNYMRLGYGGGLRIMMDKQTRTRLEVEAGAGGKSVGLYLGAQETF